MKLFDTSLLPGKAEFFMDTTGQPVPYFCEELQLFYVLTGSAELHSLALDCTLRQNDFAVVNPYERYVRNWCSPALAILSRCAAARSDGCKAKAAMPSGGFWHSFCSGRAAVLGILTILFSAGCMSCWIF